MKIFYWEIAQTLFTTEFAAKAENKIHAPIAKKITGARVGVPKKFAGPRKKAKAGKNFIPTKILFLAQKRA